MNETMSIITYIMLYNMSFNNRHISHNLNI